MLIFFHLTIFSAHTTFLHAHLFFRFESILFSVLIGIGCDYVLHFGSAYIMYQGNVSRHERTRFAILHMGPSILASGASTLITAIIMVCLKYAFVTKAFKQRDKSY